jgi:8-oxo-dGTP diphosphatase/2-hydroxy-dATP diphosphatase
MKKPLTLVLVHQGDKILLGMKKRGFGAGNWNGFGGKLEEGETIEEAARRELFEECGLSAETLEKMGVLEFHLFEGKILEVHIFKCRDFTGLLGESEEMMPQWFDVAKIPYDKMWADDTYWLPMFLADKKFGGECFFDADNKIINHNIKELQLA